MKREYWWILLFYTLMHLSAFVGVPVVTFIGVALGKDFAEMEIFAAVFWIVFSFVVTLMIVLFLLRKEMKQTNDLRQMPLNESLIWAVLGVFLALFSQVIAAQIEAFLGITTESENTQQIIALIEAFPIVILVSSIIGPILEEIVFRKIIFGSLYKRFNFWIAAIISSIIFALAHQEPEHLLLYSSMGFVFSFLYIKTKRIIVPIFAHVAMNTFVVLIQYIYKDEIQELINRLETTNSFIGGLFL